MKAKRYICFYILLPLLLELIIESLSRKSLFAGFSYLLQSPLLFLFNTLIIMLTMSIAMFFRREIFVLVTISAVWLIFGIANFIILHFRVTPFSAVDFTLIKSAIRVSGHYLNLFSVAMLAVAFGVLLVGLVCLFRKAPVHSEYSHKRILFSAVFIATLGMAILVIHKSSHSVQALATNYTNISEAYENYGFAYCFANSIIDTGIAKPDDYSEESVNEIVNSLKDVKNKDEKPNIIMIQLESFFDVNYVKGLSFSEDPLPIFHWLQEKYSSGLVTVPTVGAGTVNTEFEILTGMRQHDFGVSEYPYKTILKSTTSESVCTDLKKLGYQTHAVHNNEATFYGRDKVFANLGFDTFTSMEYMNGLTDNPNGWCNDDVLTKEIIKTLNSSEEPDFTMAITVQSHGKYEGIEQEEPQRIQVSGAPEGMEDAYQYYVNQIYEVDRMIGALINELNKRDEKSILVLYGDHLPSLNIQKEDLTNGNLYQTQYVIWDNMDLKKKDRDLYSYQLYAETLKQVGIHEGLITRYHQQTKHNAKTYLSGLTTLSYDLLYGSNYAYNEKNPFKATKLQMGIDPIAITRVEKVKGGYEIQGRGFTPFAKVYYDDEGLETEFKDSTCLFVGEELTYDPDNEEYDPETVESPTDIPNAFVVKIESEDGVELSVTDALSWTETDLSK